MATNTPLGITYPEAGDHTRTWEHWQKMAEDIDTLLTPAAVTNATIGFAPRTGWSLDQADGIKFGPVRFLLLRLTRTGSDIVASADGNIPDEALGDISNADWRSPSELAYITAQARCAVASADAVIYDTGLVNIAALNGSGATIRTNDFLRVSFSWSHLSWDAS